MLDDIFGRAARVLLDANKIVCFTGAGISVESGIPTYRDRLTGLWARHNPEHLETAKAFRENPPLVWGWYLWRRRQVAQAEPNAAHLALRQIASLGRRVSIITQNIDDLHERAGSVEVLHLHGSLAKPKCFACHRPAELSQDQTSVAEEGALIDPPRCKRCNGKLRPGVLWFGEDLPSGVWKSAIALVKSCDVLISVGTSGVVTPAADIPELALSSRAVVIHVNTKDVGMGDPNELMLIGRAAEVLSHLCTLISNEGRRV
jgi:NAD-dependent deacetylase